MIKFENEMNDLIAALDRSNLLDSCIISGSWAMYFYKQIFEGFIPPIATTDFDIFLPSVSKIKNSDIAKQLLDLDYIRNDDYISGKTTFYSKDGFDVEFLTIPNKQRNNVIFIKNIGIGAEALPKMNIIAWNYISVEYEKTRINIPSPASYCLQKLLINEERSDAKKEKDIDAIKYVLGYIGASNKYRAEFKESLSSMPKKWRNTILKTIDLYGLDNLFGWIK